MSTLRRCASSISSADHGIAHPPRHPEAWRMVWRNCRGVWLAWSEPCQFPSLVSCQAPGNRDNFFPAVVYSIIAPFLFFSTLSTLKSINLWKFRSYYAVWLQQPCYLIYFLSESFMRIQTLSLSLSLSLSLTHTHTHTHIHTHTHEDTCA